MNSRERVLAAISHREPDRVPVDFGGSMVTSIHKVGYDKLKKHLGIKTNDEVKIARGRSLVAEVDPEVQDALGVDARMLIINDPDAWTRQTSLQERERIRDEWGMTWERPEGVDNFEIVDSPLFGPDVSIEDVKAMSWPDPEEVRALGSARDRALELRRSDKAVIANLAMQIHTQSYFLRGYSEYMMDLLLNPRLIEAIMDRVLEVFLGRTRAILKEVGDLVDVVYVADDLGMQTGPMMSPDVYRELLKPRQEKLFEVIKSGTDAKILYHSCGSVVAFIEDLVDVGVDILNPVQVSAKGMDTKELKKLAAGRLSFWGGIDSHDVLPFQGPKQVKDEVRRRIEDLGEGGGYVVAAVHNIRPEVPPENIVAMVEAVHEYGGY